VDLSDVASGDIRNFRAPEAGGAVRCRQILVELLQPLGDGAAGWAERLVAEFGSLAGALAAGPGAQARVLGDARALGDGKTLGDGGAVVRYLGAVRQAMVHSLRTEALAGPRLADSQSLINYLFLDMAHLPTERLRVLFLNSANRLLYDETVAEGSVNETPIYPREIMRRALEIGATALILVHNHPSGDPRPSAGDIDATKRVIQAARALDIGVHDHVIVARSGWTSFRALGLLQGGVSLK
jgi:DNA repair protein RadC